MEFISAILEILLEIIIEGTIELGTSKKVKLPIRILLILVFLLIYGGIIGVIAMVGMELWQDGNTACSLMVLGSDVLLAVLVVCWIVKQYRKNNKSK